MIDIGEIILRIILSAIIGGLIGIEREVNNRPAGLRTHILVSVGSALIMLVSIDGFNNIRTGFTDGDPARLAAQVVSGVGFLGAGTIMRTKNDIKGLTTAASLWVCAGIGLAIGNGYYLGGIFTASIVLIALMSLGSFEKKVFKTNYKILEVVSTNRPGLIGEIGILLGKYDISIKDIFIPNTDYDDSDNDSTILEIHFTIKIPKNLDNDKFLDEIYKIKGVVKAVFDGNTISKK
ncbi:MgtC/SapB family protein [Schnuerera sp. xch1]|uniref:MgtC/SapB family protein n=1 Tax=Schnuerera sp. xch1 TaxID=2874283 RepID=UPI001CBE8933|nr:MgtC/SapB family protein [Schnuerera sp. xch1]MBZ2174217.1 MgtC/SapB family protein [Schnuerera sp. xch1]